jgi:hypothetical protein
VSATFLAPNRWKKDPSKDRMPPRFRQGFRGPTAKWGATAFFRYASLGRERQSANLRCEAYTTYRLKKHSLNDQKRMYENPPTLRHPHDPRGKPNDPLSVYFTNGMTHEGYQDGLYKNNALQPCPHCDEHENCALHFREYQKTLQKCEDCLADHFGNYCDGLMKMIVDEYKKRHSPCCEAQA